MPYFKLKVYVVLIAKPMYMVYFKIEALCTPYCKACVAFFTLEVVCCASFSNIILSVA